MSLANAAPPPNKKNYQQVFDVLVPFTVGKQGKVFQTKKSTTLKQGSSLENQPVGSGSLPSSKIIIPHQPRFLRNKGFPLLP